MSTALETKTTTQIKPVNLWQVKLLNDDFTPMEFVVEVLIHLFHKNAEEAEAIMMAIHQNGKGVAGIYVKEIAEQKAKEVVRVARSQGHPLMAVAEEG